MSPARLPGLLLLALLAAACGGEADARESLVTIDSLPGGIPVVTTAAPIDSGRWALVHERDVRPPSDAPGELLEPNDLALADDGTLYVVEESPAAINAFAPDGEFRATLAREGSGPGEVRNAWIALRGDTLIVQDPRQSRATLLHVPDGAVISTRTTFCCRSRPIGVDAEGRGVLWMPSDQEATATSQPRQRFLRFSVTGDRVDTVAILVPAPDPDLLPWQVDRDGQLLFSESVPLRPGPIQAVDPTGGFVTGWTGTYSLVVSRNGTDTVMVFGRPFTNDPVSAAEKQAIVDERISEYDLSWWNGTVEVLRAAFTPEAIPDVRPAIEGLWVDRNGRRWVMLSATDSIRAVLDLFDREGRWLDQLVLPQNHWVSKGWRPVAFARDRVAVLLNDDAGAPFVRIYRIVRNED